MYGGYTGKILRVDLSTGTFKELSTWDYVPDYIGGIGIGYKILWDETNASTTEWSPENALIFTTGPCTGTPVPTAGRAEVVGIAPMGYPKPWACPSGFGGDFGPKLKFAGYDAIVIVGKAQSLKYLYISEGGSQLVDGEPLRGMATYTTQDALVTKHGMDIAVACIGPAGENLVRWATIQSRTESSAGQGGFGAVMGDKKLKAIVVQPGSHRIEISKPDKLIEEVIRTSHELSPMGQTRVPLFADKDRYTVRWQSCGWASCTGGMGGLAGCLVPVYNKLPMKYSGTGTISGLIMCNAGCIGNLFGPDEPGDTRNELTILYDQLGLNSWELHTGMNWFWQFCQNAGKLPTIMGEKVELPNDGPPIYPKTGKKLGLSPEFVVKIMRGIANREGEGDVWAEGTPRAADILGLEAQAWKTHKHGYPPHWDGRFFTNNIRYPVWVVSALTWATQGRDPYNQEHGYPERYPPHVTEWDEAKWFWWPDIRRGRDTIPYEEICKAGAKIYGAEHANAGWDKPELGYVDKEYVTIWHDYRAIIKCSVPVCDRQFPLLYDSTKPDKIDDIYAEVRLFNAVVGTDWTLDDMHKACERVFNVMRAIHVRQGRTRANDESVIPYFEQPALYPDDPGPMTLEANKFLDLLDRFYAMHSWDKTTGWPTRAKLEELGLKDVADGLASIGKLP